MKMNLKNPEKYKELILTLTFQLKTSCLTLKNIIQKALHSSFKMFLFFGPSNALKGQT